MLLANLKKLFFKFATDEVLSYCPLTKGVCELINYLIKQQMIMKKLLLAFVGIAMVSFAAYSSLLSNEDVSLSSLTIENAEALASDPDEDPCPWGCLAEYRFCVCYGDHPLKEAKP